MIRRQLPKPLKGVRLSTRHKFVSNEALINRQIEKARELGPNSVKPLLANPIDYDRLPIG